MADSSERSIFTDPNLRRMIAMVRAHPRPLAVALVAMVIAALTDPAIAALTWVLTLLMVAFAPLVGGILRVFSARLRRLNVENQAMLGELTRAVQEAHEGGRVIKVYDGVGYESERFGTINDRLRRFAMKMQVA